MYSVKKLSNNKIKEIVKLHTKKYREEFNLFIAEGRKVLEEFLNSDIEIQEIFATDDLISNLVSHSAAGSSPAAECSPFQAATLKFSLTPSAYRENLFGQIINNSNIPLTIIDKETMKKISTTSSACEVLLIAKKKYTDIKTISNKNKIILLNSISDPGNLGTIIRSAAAFNIEGIILYGDCVDLYSSKVIRSAAGNFLKVPIISIKNINELNKYFKNHIKITTELSEKNNTTIEEISKLKKYIIMFGSEAVGLDYDLVNISNKNLIIKMRENVESLNLSVSASIILYELFK